ncbi:MAG: hypothetical protein AB8C84_11710 [Oligoflexales bacterium]
MWQKKAREFDAALKLKWPEPRSLCPNRDCAHTLEDIGERLQTSLSHEQQNAVMQSLTSIAMTQLECFPKNIFWDFDGFVSVLLKKTDFLSQRACVEHFQKLYKAFSRGQTRFQYAHDLIYGFDWARWVQKDPENHVDFGPFDECFLNRMSQRHDELVEEVEKRSSSRYPYVAGLDHGQGYRNPFEFSRNFEDEKDLMERLALIDYIPVPFWDMNFKAVWDKDFEEKRKEISQRTSL